MITSAFADIRRGIEDRVADEMCELRRQNLALRVDAATSAELLLRAIAILELHGQKLLDSNRQSLIEDIKYEMKHMEVVE